MLSDNIKINEVQFANSEFIPEIVKLLEQGHTVTLRLKGYSMRPFLEDNRDKALLTKAKEVHVGQAVLAEVKPREYVLHRVIAINGHHVTLLGDGNLIPEHCLLQDVKASVIGFYRKGKTILDYTSARKWRWYSAVWMRLLPIRRYLLGVYRRLWIPVFGPI